MVTSAAQGTEPQVNDALWIFDHDGRLHSGPFAIAQDIGGQTTYRLGAPAIADFTGDDQLEIAIAATKNQFPPFSTFEDPSRMILRLFSMDGNLLWQKDLIAELMVNGAPPVTGFDFDGDGATEIVFLDRQKLYILNGMDGEILFEIAISRSNEGAPIRYVTVADVDNDGNAELIVPTYKFYESGSPPRNGVLVIGDSLDNWGHARRVWNQWQYHVTHINEDNSVPSPAANNWETYNNIREQVPIAGIPQFAAPDLSVSYVNIGVAQCPTNAGISARIGNGGSLHVPAGLDVNFYLGDPQVSGVLLGTVPTSQALYPGEFEDVIYWTLAFFA